MAWWPETLSEWILIISGIATAGLVLVVWRQFALTRKEMDTRLRPWVAPVKFETSHVVFPNETNEPYDRFMENRGKFPTEPTSIQYNITVQNTGTTPSTKITKKFLSRKRKFSRKYLEKLVSDENEFFSLMPGSTQNILALTNYKDIVAGEAYYIGLALEYEISKKKKGYSGKIWMVEKLGHQVLNDWIE